jgi:predicted tellurium resistance membrane protein TerC
MRKNRNLGVFFSPILFLVGAHLLDESTGHSQWYMDIYLIAGATISAIGLMIFWLAIRRRLTIRRLEQHVRTYR